MFNLTQALTTYLLSNSMSLYSIIRWQTALFDACTFQLIQQLAKSSSYFIYLANIYILPPPLFSVPSRNGPHLIQFSLYTNVHFSLKGNKQCFCYAIKSAIWKFYVIIIINIIIHPLDSRLFKRCVSNFFLIFRLPYSFYVYILHRQRATHDLFQAAS